MDITNQFAVASESVNGGITEMLGIDWKMLIFQIIAFLVMVLLLGKFVYPWLVKSIDDRQKKIDIGAKAAVEAKDSALEAEKRIGQLMREARTEANEIVTAAKAESAATLSATEEKSKKLANQTATAAREQIDKDVLAAQKALHNEMIELVALATEKVVGSTVSKDIDNTLIAKTIKDDK